MTRHVYSLPNKDIQLGDFPARLDDSWLNLAWIVTHHCTMNCPYCIGWKSKVPTETVIDKCGGIEKTVAQFLKFRDASKKNLYITISGGEPTLVKDLNKLIRGLTENDIMVELHTNLTNSKVMEVLDQVSPSKLAQIMATYHGWKLNKNKRAYNLYMKNFHAAWDAGFTVVLKTIVTPEKVDTFGTFKRKLQKSLPKGAPILPWVFIKGRPKSPTDANGAYPQAYTKEQRAELARVTGYRCTEQQLYARGAGFFKGMLCSAGKNYMYMDVKGNLFPCYALRAPKQALGNFVKGTYKFHTADKKCPAKYCGTPFWGLWYGTAPWKYIPGVTDKDSFFCKHGKLKGKKIKVT